MQFLTTGGAFLDKRPGFKLVGRDEELKRLSAILMRSKAASIILVGPGGVGSTALCMGLQASKDDPDSPFDIISKRFFWLNYDELFASGNPEQINTAFQKILSILRRTPDSVLLVEDAKDFIDTARSSGCGHFVNALNSAVKNRDTQVILEARDDDLGYVLKSHSDMRECYTIIDLDEPTGDALVAIAKAAAEGLEDHHSISIEEDAILKAIELTSRYQTRDASLSRAQPERTTTLLDRSLASYRMTAHKRNPKAILLEASGGDPEEVAALDAEFAAQHEELKELYKLQRDGEIAIIELEERIEKQLQEEKKRREEGVEENEPAPRSAINSFRSMSSDGGYESNPIREMRASITSYQTIIDGNRKKFEELTDLINADLALSASMVLAEFSRLSGIPADKLNEDEKEKLKNLADNIKKNLWGQDKVVESLVNAVKIARIGRRNNGKPQASFMFLGPSGVGKTEIVKLLSKEMDMELLRFDMSEYMEKNAVNTLIGAPAGYEGYENGGTLTKAIKKNPRQIVLFDEIEKADPAVFNIFLQMLDAGRLTDRFGQTVSFSEAIIIMTSNIGQPELLDFSVPTEVRHQNALDILCSTPGIRPEFLNRFAGRQNILFFNHLEVEHIAKIVRREVTNLDEAYSHSGIRTIMPDDVLLNFCTDHYDVKVGGRGLPGFIQANLEPTLANRVLEDSTFTGTMVVGYNRNTKEFTTEFRNE